MLLAAVSIILGGNLMRKFFAVLLIVFGLSLPQFAKAGPNEDAATARAQWEQVYNSGDADKFVALYTKDATLFGSTAQLFSGSDGVRAYFSKLPPGIKVKMGDQQATAVGPNVLLSSGFADFTLKDGTVIPYRLTLALVKVDGQWLIAQHHGSPVPK
jgi:uncharacterized protein (TIGR02246 family)